MYTGKSTQDTKSVFKYFNKSYIRSEGIDLTFARYSCI